MNGFTRVNANGLRAVESWAVTGTRGARGSALGVLVDDRRREQREPEVGHALEAALESAWSRTGPVSTVLPSSRVRVMPSNATAMLSLSSPSTTNRYRREPMHTSMAGAACGSGPERQDHPGGCDCSRRPTRSRARQRRRGSAPRAWSRERACAIGSCSPRERRSPISRFARLDDLTPNQPCLRLT
jgi:hypothetical protein